MECLEFLKWLLELLDTDMAVPKMYGPFHLAFFAASIIAGIVLCIVFKNANKKTTHRLLLVTALIVLVLEVYKQINYTFSFEGNQLICDYQWYAFPFQFCSTPMYISLLAGIISHKKLHDSLCAYLATFALFAGLCVMFYPAQVFIDTVGVNIQTMICHGMMISIGIYLLGTEYVRLEHKTIIKATLVFAACVLLASVMNEVAYFSGLLETETFNMFFISPHCEPSLPVYSIVQKFVPYPWCLFIYIGAFSAAAYIILLVAMSIKHCKTKHKNNIIEEYSVEENKNAVMH